MQPTEEQFNIFVPVLMTYLQKAATLSDEVRTAHKNHVVKQKEDPDFKAECDAETVANFELADVDKDGKLNLEEFLAFMRLIEQSFVTRTGGTVPTTDDDNKATYEATNTLSDGDGVTLEDYLNSKKLYAAIMQ